MCDDEIWLFNDILAISIESRTSFLLKLNATASHLPHIIQTRAANLLQTTLCSVNNNKSNTGAYLVSQQRSGFNKHCRISLLEESRLYGHRLFERLPCGFGRINFSSGIYFTAHKKSFRLTFTAENWECDFESKVSELSPTGHFFTIRYSVR